jgi:hypothetical protein
MFNGGFVSWHAIRRNLAPTMDGGACETSHRPPPTCAWIALCAPPLRLVARQEPVPLKRLCPNGPALPLVAALRH